MSIFKSTFHPFVQGQLLRRQEIVSAEQRTNEDFKWLMSKNSWARMTSCVNITAENPELRKYFNIKESDDELAKRYILMGGTLYVNPSNPTQTALRSGINQGTSTSKAYGSLGSNEFGPRPMPGITGVDVQYKSAYGSLREANVKISCWNIKQLEELEVLFLKPGYTVLLEWGWSMYPDNNSTNIVSNNNYIDVFKPGITQQGIYNEWSRLTEKSFGNYDSFYGIVKNFEISSREDGGYDISTEIVTVGEILPSLAINAPQDSYDYSDTKDDSTSTPDSIYVDNYSSQTSKLGKLLINFVKKVNDDNGQQTFLSMCNGKDKKHIDFFVYSSNLNAGNTETTSKYISWGALAELINERILLKDQKNGQVAYIDTTYNNTFEDTCKISPICLSIDPTVCLVRTVVPISYKSREGNVSVVQAPGVGSTEVNPLGWVKPNTFFTATSPKYAVPFGRINNIYINVDHVLKMLVNTTEETVGVTDFIGRLFQDIGNALGNINKFKISEGDNKIQVVDVQYIQESKDEVLKKLKLKYNNKEDYLYVLGSKSVVRQYKLNTTIFPEQAALIAIAAQAIGYTGNNTDVSTWQLINKGLTDRILVNKLDENQTTSKELENKIKSAREITLAGFDSVKVLAGYIEKLLLFGTVEIDKIPQYSGALDFLNNTYWPQKLVSKKQFTAEQVSSLFCDVLPIKLSMTLDGMSGFVIGQCFCIDPSVLPRSYKLTNTKPKIAFTITDIKHNIINSDWTTTLTGNMIMIDALETYNQQ
jgi:hypothetical protein